MRTLRFLAAIIFLALSWSSVDAECPDCANYADGVLLRDPDDCAHYYKCVDGQAIRTYCGRGFYFDDRFSICNFAVLVDCRIGDKATTTEAPCTKNHYHTTEAPCTRKHSRTTEAPCTEKYHRTTEAPCTEKHPRTTKAPYTRRPQRTTEAPCTEKHHTTTEVPCTDKHHLNTTEAPCTDKHHRNTTEAPCTDKYYRSTTEAPCTDKLHHTTKAPCTEKHDTTTWCSTTTCKPVTTACTTPKNCENPTDDDIPDTFQYLSDCKNRKDGTILLDGKHCRRYYTCRNGRARHERCSLGQWFDRQLKACKNRDEVTNCPANRN